MRQTGERESKRQADERKKDKLRARQQMRGSRWIDRKKPERKRQNEGQRLLQGDRQGEI